MMKTITINITTQDDGGDTMDELLRLLSWMDICSTVGHNAKFDVNYFGDWSAHVKVACLEGKEDYDRIRKEIADDYVENHVEPKTFSF